ncbi:MAG: hypothetical protein L0H93_18415 [Nocardioides sp.]|nr:hypothetical protein [Nocardioides sp.]
MSVNDDGQDAAFAMNASVSSALGTLTAQQADLRPGADRDGAYHYARGQRYELLSNTPGVSEPFAPFLVIGLVISGLESRSVPYHPQELLAVTEVVCLEDSSTWSLSPLHEAIVRGLSEQTLTENLVLACAGLLAGIANAIGTDAATLAARHRTALSEGMIGPIDWDQMLGRTRP